MMKQRVSKDESMWNIGVQGKIEAIVTQAAEKVEHKLPLQYAKYAKVFDEPGDGELPPW